MTYVHGLVGKSINGGASADNYGLIAGPMAFDIATVQYLYGANTGQNTGNNTYILPDANAAGTFFLPSGMPVAQTRSSIGAALTRQ